MEEVIREGALRLLTTETSCDVIISCRGYRLMAHRVMLSIASPVLQGLLLQDTSQPTVLIFPDISGSTMSLILDYIYSGSVSVNSTILPDFLGVARELRLQLDVQCSENSPSPESKTLSYLSSKYKKNETDYSTKTERSLEKETSGRCFDLYEVKGQKRTLRKVPNLMPISSFRSRKGLYNRVIPSPWCPRVSPLLADPREDCLGPTDLPEHGKKTPVEQNDSNNNSFRMLPAVPLTVQNERRMTKTNASPKNLVNTKYPPCHHLSSISTLAQSEQKIKNPENKPDPVIRKSNGEDVNVDGEKRNNEEAEEQRSDRQKPFTCKDCGKSFSQLRNFKYHRSIHEGTKEFAARCPECGKTFNDKGYLSSHMKIHRDRKEYGCPHCPKRFNQRVAYNMHLRIHTGIKPHECPTCGKTFSRKMLLKQHQRVHTGERPYACPECGKSFADRSNMSLHARLHTGVKPYECNLCSKSFTKKHHLKTHMNFHTGLKPYSCQKCGLSFSQSSNMRTHYKKCILKATNASETADVR